MGGACRQNSRHIHLSCFWTNHSREHEAHGDKVRHGQEYFKSGPQESNIPIDTQAEA